MTDSKILAELKEDFKSVTTSVTELSGEISGLNRSVKNIEKTMDKHDERITQTREAQLRATEGIVVLNREMRDEKKKHRDQTGGVPLLVAGASNGSIAKKVAGRYWPLMILALFMVGFYFGSGGDEEKTEKMLQTFGETLGEIGMRTERIEQAKTEPVRVAVPVSSECYSEETAP